MSISPHLWKSEPSLPENSKLSWAKPPPTMANTLVQAVLMADSTSSSAPGSSTRLIFRPLMPPCALHHSEKATDASHISLLRPGRIVDVRSVATPMLSWSVAPPPSPSFTVASPGPQTSFRSP